MKKYIIGSITILIIFILILAVKVHSTGTTTQIMGASLVGLEVPRLSMITDEHGEYVASFNSFRSIRSLEKEFKNILSNYEQCFEDGASHYYNKNNNTTILNYKIERGFIVNSYTIHYVKGNACN